MPEGGAIIDHRLLGGAIRLWVGYDAVTVGPSPSPGPTSPTAWWRWTGWPPSPTSGDGASAPPSPGGPSPAGPTCRRCSSPATTVAPSTSASGFLAIHRCTVVDAPGMIPRDESALPVLQPDHESRDLVRRRLPVVLHRQAPLRGRPGALRAPRRRRGGLAGVRARPGRARWSGRANTSTGWQSKYRIPVAEAEAMVERVTRVGDDAGVDFRFDRARAGNTFDAHRLLHLGLERGVQDAVKERLMAATFTEGRPTGRPGDAARGGGGGRARRGRGRAPCSPATPTPTRSGPTRRWPASFGITAVPFFVIDRKPTGCPAPSTPTSSSTCCARCGRTRTPPRTPPPPSGRRAGRRTGPGPRRRPAKATPAPSDRYWRACVARGPSSSPSSPVPSP